MVKSFVTCHNNDSTPCGPATQTSRAMAGPPAETINRVHPVWHSLINGKGRETAGPVRIADVMRISGNSIIPNLFATQH